MVKHAIEHTLYQIPSLPCLTAHTPPMFLGYLQINQHALKSSFPGPASGGIQTKIPRLVAEKVGNVDILQGTHFFSCNYV